MGGGIKQGIYINIWRCEINNEYLFFNGYATYAHMIVIFNFTLSTHLIVDTGCQFYLHMSYISSFAYSRGMYARACDRCVYGYAIILDVLVVEALHGSHVFCLSSHVRWRCAGAQRENTKRILLLFSYGNIICRHLPIFFFFWII